MFKICLLIVLFASGCQAQMQAWQKDRFITRISKVENYHGRFTETGLADKPLNSEVWFTAPANYTLVSDDGSFLISEPGALKMYDPKSHVAITYTNLPVIDLVKAKEALSAQFDQNAKNFTYTLGPYAKVAGLDTIELRFVSKSLKVLLEGTSQVYDPYSFPLKTKLKFKSGNYEIAFSEIDFNRPFAAKIPSIPADAIVSEWDFSSKTYTLDEAQKEATKAGFKFELPKTDLELIKIIRQKGPIAAFTAFFAKGPRSLSVMAFKDSGLAKNERGVKTSQGLLRPGPHFNSYSKTANGTILIYTFNGSLDDITTF